ncbi:uncharacterized protein LOC133191793 [Saccostrea echinata]|uniref:uncharacterized protein LOC133191793 n=1 Tax=Saccostrea echinata TaxID=191078 RepID=UPI002A7EB81F|nr:uncharacterized protein LOC133191793 [Saccostrea echinata]
MSSLHPVQRRGGIINGYLHAVKLYTSTNKNVEITAKCYWSMKKSEDPHKINMTINYDVCVIDDSHCSCQAGLSGTCAHTTALIYTIQHYKRLGLNQVPAELPCTSLPQQWHKPRGTKIQPEPLSSMVFSKPKPTPRKKKPVYVDKPN